MDTIVAIATAPGIGGIGIVRISGNRAFEIGEALYSGKRTFFDVPANYLFHGIVEEKSTHAFIDEAMFVKMANPNSFTAEDVVEIHCHGGRVVLSKVIDLAMDLGARLAEPGEFTKRAFLNGRLDLSQAEAVADIIHAKTLESSKAAMDQLEGRLSKQIGVAKSTLVEIIAHIEANLDYPEFDIEELTTENLKDAICSARSVVKDLLSTFDRGRLLREGVTIAITGKPNVGKSSLLNRLAGRQRAIVTAVPGTTRDIIDEYIDLNGIPARIVDTAGIRDTNDEVEKIGVEMARKEVQNADFVVAVLDAEAGVLQAEVEMLTELERSGKKVLVVLNKIDTQVQDLGAAVPDAHLRVSLLTDAGVAALIQALGALVSAAGSDTDTRVAASGPSASPDSGPAAAWGVPGDTLVTNARHKQLLGNAASALDSALAALEAQAPVDCISGDLMAACSSLGEITGESVSEEIVNEIFSKFCIGK